MNVYVVMNWGAWILSAILFGWVLFNFVKTEKTYKESVLTGAIDQDEIESHEG